MDLRCGRMDLRCGRTDLRCGRMDLRCGRMDLCCGRIQRDAINRRLYKAFLLSMIFIKKFYPNRIARNRETPYLYQINHIVETRFIAS